jgi:hypothetical protein
MSIENKANDIYGQLQSNVKKQATTDYGYNEMSGVLDDLYGNSKNSLTRQSNYDMGRAKQGAVARNSHVTGSLKEDIVANAGKNVIKGKYDALGKLEGGRMGSNLNAMQMDNRNVLSQQQLKNQALSQLARFMPTLMEAENQPGLLDDIFAGLNVGANVLGMPTGKFSTLFSDLFIPNKQKKSEFSNISAKPYDMQPSPVSSVPTELNPYSWG